MVSAYRSRMLTAEVKERSVAATISEFDRYVVRRQIGINSIFPYRPRSSSCTARSSQQHRPTLGEIFSYSEIFVP